MLRKDASMKTTALPAFSTLVLPLLLGLIVIAVTYAVITGRQVPLVTGPRAALVILLIVGMTMCATGGISQVGASGNWVSPLAILGYILGTLLLVIIIAGLAGWKLPLLTSDKDMVLATAGLIGAKYLIGTISYFFHLL
jgi:hypothetical protein